MHVQTPVAHRRSLPILLAIVLALVGVTGCAKQRANMAVSKTQTRLQDAKRYDAEKYQTADLQATEQKLASAQKNMDGGAFDAALVDAKAAQEAATKLLSDTLTAGATALVKENAVHLDVLRRNKLDSGDKFTEITTLSTQAQEAFNKQRYEKSMIASRQLKEKVDLLLTELRERSEKNWRDANAKFDTFKDEEQGLAEAETQYNEIVKKLADLKDLISVEQRKYLDGEQAYTEVSQLVDKGTTAARKSRSDKLIKILEDKLTTAVIEEAETYRLEQLRDCQDRLQDILKNYEALDYQQVLSKGALLDPALDRLILESRLQAAKANVEKVRAGIRQQDNGKAREHLPGRLEKVETILAQAEQEFSQDLYNECKKTCKIALDELDAISKDFDVVAGTAITDASSKLDEADNILTQMNAIFETQSSPSSDPLEQAFESSKKGLQTQLDTIGKGAEVLLAAAKVQREEKAFDNAIQSSRKVVGKSSRIIHDVYQVVAHNNIMELAKAITDREADGAADLASQELQRAKDDLKKSREMMLDVAAAEKADAQQKNVQLADLDVAPEAYRPTVSSTSEARADIESILQRMKESVGARITAARDSLAEAEKNKGPVYSPGPLSTAHSVLEQADSLLLQGKHSEAVAKAVQARQLAFESSVQAARTWTSEELNSARTEIEKAEAANVVKDALKRLRDAEAKKAEADDLFAKAAQLTDPALAIADLTQSRDLAMAAALDAQGARMNKIITAEQTINAAKRFNAWKYDYPLLVDSITLAKQSMEAMQRGDYQTSSLLAQQATDLAKQAMDHTKEVTHYNRAQDLSQQAEKVGDNGAAYFEQDKYLPLLLRLQEIRAGYTVQQFETISAELDRFENDLLAVASKTPEAFDNMVKGERDRIEKYAKRGARDFALTKMTKAEQFLHFAEIDFKKNDPSTAYHDIMNASGILTSIETRLAEIQFANDVTTLLSQIDDELKWIRGFRSLSKVEFQRVFAVTRPTQTGNAVIEGSDPAKFREAMDALVLKSEAVKYPPTLLRQYTAQVHVFALARQSAEAFEKFTVLGLYDEKGIGKIVSQAYDNLEQALKERAALMQDLEEKQLPGQLDNIKRIAGQ
jgi:hypothetical protein